MEEETHQGAEFGADENEEYQQESKDEAEEGEEENVEEMEREAEVEVKEYEAEEDGEEEEEVEMESTKKRKRRCQRKKKYKLICVEECDEDEEEEDEEAENEGGGEEEEDDAEEEEEEDGDYDESSDFSTGTSILSALSFQWNDKSYEFEELCDPGTIANIYEKVYAVKQHLVDGIGINRYLYICKILVISPILRLLKSFKTDEIDLSHRGIDGKNMRAMCVALEKNAHVKKLILRHNKLSKEDCSHLGELITFNETLCVLDLTGCRIGPDGTEELIKYMHTSDTLLELNLSKCNIQDEGMTLLSPVLMKNSSIKKLDLSYNNLKEEAVIALATALKFNNTITDLNLRYNCFYDPTAMKEFFRSLLTNESITTLNLSWNGMSGKEVGKYLGSFLKKSTTIKYLDLSDNRFDEFGVAEIRKGLKDSSSLKVLKMGRNPFLPEDPNVLLKGAKECLTLEVLDLENVWVMKSFTKLLARIQSERNLQVIIEGVIGNYVLHRPDFAEILLKRAQFEAKKPKFKKNKKDFGHFIWDLGDEPLTPDQFVNKFNAFKAKVDEELISQIITEFTNPSLEGIDVVALRNKYLSIFPDSTPAPKLPKKKRKRRRTKTTEQDEVFLTLEESAHGEETERKSKVTIAKEFVGAEDKPAKTDAKFGEGEETFGESDEGFEEEEGKKGGEEEEEDDDDGGEEGEKISLVKTSEIQKKENADEEN